MLGQYGFLAKVRILHSSLKYIIIQFGSFCNLQFQFQFHSCNLQAQVFSIFEDLGISVDCVATSEVSISLTLDPSKLWSRELIQQARMN